MTTTPTPHGAPELPKPIYCAKLARPCTDGCKPEPGRLGDPCWRVDWRDLGNVAATYQVSAAIQQAAGAVPEGMRVDLTQLYRRAKVYSSIAASPHHMTFTVEALRNLIEEFAPPAPPKQQPDSVHLAAPLTDAQAQAVIDSVATYSGSYEIAIVRATEKALRGHLAACECGGVQVPLTEEQIEKLAVEHEAFGFGRVDGKGFTTHGFDPDGLGNFARAIEAAHGIGNAPRPSAPTGQINPDSAVAVSALRKGDTCRHGISSCLVCMNNRANSAPVAQGKEADHGG